MPGLLYDKLKGPFPRKERVNSMEVEVHNESDGISQNIKGGTARLAAVCVQLEQIACEAEDVEFQTPETFTLQPLTSRPVTVHIIRRQTPAFQYFVDDELTIEDIAE